MVFEPDETEPWPHDFEVNKDLLAASKGVSHRANVINIHSNTNHQILLKGRTVLGRLDPVKLIVSADVKLTSTTVKDSTQNRAVFEQKDTSVAETKLKISLQIFSSSLTCVI